MNKHKIIPTTLKELEDLLPEGTVHIIKSGEPLLGEDRFAKLYHTTSLQSFLLIWAKKRLKFAPVLGVNDMIEKVLRIKDQNPQMMPVLFALQDIRKKYKQISFTMDFDTSKKGYQSPLLWGIYGDKNNGVCIELDYNKLNLPENSFGGVVNYKEDVYPDIEIPKDIVSINSLKSFIREKQDILFFTKEKCWEYENEYRIITDSADYLDISNAVSAVYVANIDGLTYEIVEALLKDTNIRFEYVSFNHSIRMLSSTDARQYKTSSIDAENNPDNFLKVLAEQAKEHYESLKNDPNADLTKSEYDT